MTAAAGNLRTIWISIRALNYTERVFNDVIKGMESTINSENKMVTSMRAGADEAMHFVAAGTLMVTLASMIGMQIYNLAAASQQGAAQMAELQQKFTLAQQSLANAAFHVLEASGALNILNTILDLINNNPALAQLIIAFALLMAGILAVAGIIFILNGAFMMLTNTLPLIIVSLYQMVTGVTLTESGVSALTASVMGLEMALGLVAAAFMIFMMIGQAIGSQAGAIVAAVTAITMAFIALGIAEDWISFGALTPLQAGAIAAGAAMAAGVMAIQSGAFQSGTRALPSTGLFMGHKGEVVYNPATNRPSQVGADLTGGQGETNTFNMPIVIENVHTKADIDDVNEKLRIALRERMRGRK